MAATVSAHAFVAPVARAREPRILAVAFDSHQLATQALQAALGLQDDHALVVHDAVMLSGAAQGGADVVLTTDPTPVAAAVPATLVGALVGTLIAGPVGLLIGGVLAGGSGAILAKLADTGIPSHVITELRATVLPGQFVLALLMSEQLAGAVTSYAMRCSSFGRATILPYG